MSTAIADAVRDLGLSTATRATPSFTRPSPPWSRPSSRKTRRRATSATSVARPPPSASRTYTGPGSVTAVAEQQVVRMRRACYTDAALLLTEPDTVTISGTCAPKDIGIGIGVSVTTQGTGVLLRMATEQATNP